jgi:hypothetical protein
VINNFLGRSTDAVTNEGLSNDKIAEELTAGQLKRWPKKGFLPTGKLSVKYAMLNIIRAANWVPTNHSSGITPSLAKLFYLIGDKS